MSDDATSALRRSEALYRAFIRDNSEAIWRFELTQPMPAALSIDDQIAHAFRYGRLAECNDAMARMYGYERAGELTGARLPDLLVESDPANLAYIRAFIESGYRLNDVESHERDRDGRDKYFVNSLVGIVEDGQLTGAWGTQRDITDQKLSDLRGRLTALADASGVLLRSLETNDIPDTIVRVSRGLVPSDAVAVWLLSRGVWSVAANVGLSPAYSRDAAVAGSPVAFDEPMQVPDLEADATPARLELYRREGIRSMLVVPLRISDSNTGCVVFYQRTPRMFTEVEVRVAGAIGSIAASALHIAQLYAERSAAAQRATFLARAGSLLSSSLDVDATLTQVAALAVPHIADWCAIHIVQPDGLIAPLAVAHVNPAKREWALELQERYPTDQSGRTGVSAVIRSGEPQIVSTITDEMLAASARDEEHLRILREMKILSALMVPMTAHGRTIGAISFITTGESGRHLSEDDLTLALQLASRAATAIENARLYSEAQEANRLKDEFFATLSHELRTPINAVLGWAQLLRDGVLAEKGEGRAIDAISRNARAQAQLLTDILEMSRIVSGKLELAREHVDLGSLTAELIESLRPTFDARRISVHQAIDPGLTIAADRTRLQQVLFNLLSNAAKFTDERGRIDVIVRRADDAAELEVRDDGVGIPPEFMPFVFERFRQADSSSTRQHGGLGIGLAVTRHIVELHGGTVAAASDGPGKGATFTVRLPLTSR